MNKNILIAIGILTILIVGVIFLDFDKKRAVDWRETYSERHTKPYGVKVFYEQLQDLFPEKKIRTVFHTPSNFLSEHTEFGEGDHIAQGNYIIVGDSYDMGYYSIEELVSFAETGNNVFISSKRMPTVLEELLEFTVDSIQNKSKSSRYSLSENVLPKDVTLDSIFVNHFFNRLPVDSLEVLGHAVTAMVKKPNFIKVNKGQGSILLHLEPKAFTNFELLKGDNYTYVEGLLSYLPNKDVYYSSYYQYYDYGYDGDGTSTPRAESHSDLGYIMDQKAFRWAWYIGLLFLFLFMLFAAKRRQRIIKVLKPLQNTSLAFVTTIANLYFETNDHKNLVQKKITYFLERVRTDFRLETDKLDEEFIEELAAKSGQHIELVSELIEQINTLKGAFHIQEYQLITLNKLIEDFYTS